MALRLLLVRHAQAADKQDGQSDRERVLTTRGMQDARNAGKYLWQQGLQPQLIVASSAQRAVDTAQIIAKEFSAPSPPIAAHDDHYETISDVLIAEIRTFPPHIHTAMVVNHNPTITHLVTMLTGSTAIAMYPCAVAVVTFDAPSWDKIIPGTGRLEAFLTPHDINKAMLS